MINIKLTIPGQKQNISISQFTGNNNNEINGCKFWINTEIKNPDVWFVFENIETNNESTIINPKNVIYLNSETSFNEDHFLRESTNNYLSQYSFIYTTYETKQKSEKALPFLPWMINANHGDSIFAESKRDINFFFELKKLEKTKTLSIICSDKEFTDGQKKRLDFVHELKNYFGSSLDWYGNGINPLKEKWDGISSYKYHISIENNQKDYLISEKLMDSFLGLSFPFYFGARNASNFFGNNSFSMIDINNLDKSIQIIEEGIEKNLYEKNFEYLLKSKNLVLEEYNVFFRISKIARDILDKKQQRKSKTTIKNISFYQNKYNKKQRLINLFIFYAKKLKGLLKKQYK